MATICCEDMKNNMYSIFEDASNIEIEQTDKTVYYCSKFDEYGIPIYDGENGAANSYVLIDYCPWCGKRLPSSKRDEWFSALEKLGIENPLEVENIPEKFKTSEWFNSARDVSLCSGKLNPKGK